MEKIIKALRCSASVIEGFKCDEECPYRTLEEIKPELFIKADVEINGVMYWESCDCDRIVLDAADALERLIKDCKNG